MDEPRPGAAAQSWAFPDALRVGGIGNGEEGVDVCAPRHLIDQPNLMAQDGPGRPVIRQPGDPDTGILEYAYDIPRISAGANEKQAVGCGGRQGLCTAGHFSQAC